MELNEQASESWQKVTKYIQSFQLNGNIFLLRNGSWKSAYHGLTHYEENINIVCSETLDAEILIRI